MKRHNHVGSPLPNCMNVVRGREIDIVLRDINRYSLTFFGALVPYVVPCGPVNDYYFTCLHGSKVENSKPLNPENRVAYSQ